MVKRIIASTIEDNRREQAILDQGIHKINSRKQNRIELDPKEENRLNKRRKADRWNTSAIYV